MPPDISGTSSYERACRHRQAGQLAEAEAACLEALASDPAHGESHHLLGVIAQQRGRSEAALAHFAAAVERCPGTIDFRLDLGDALYRLGRLEAAAQCFRELLELDPGRAEAHYNLAEILTDLGRHHEAEAAYRDALRLKPDFPHAQNNLALLLEKLGRTTAAEAAFRALIDAQPGYFRAHGNLGLMLVGLGRFAEAETSLRAALDAGGGTAEVCHGLGNALRGLGRLPEAEAWHRRAVELDPKRPNFRNDHGWTLRDLGQFAAAEAAFREALRLSPDAWDLHRSLGVVLGDVGRFDEAEASFREALRLAPGAWSALDNLGIALQNLGRLAEAEACYRRALEASPDSATTRFNLSVVLLLAGRLREAWPEYEHRWRLKHVPRRDFAPPQWAGEDLLGRTILLHAEQGFGDTIQFCRYAPLVAKRARVVLEAQPELAPLLRSLHGVGAVVVKGQPLPDFDVHCPLLTLPGLFGTTLATIPADVPYLTADPERVTLWRARLAGLRGPKIGLVWAESPPAPWLGRDPTQLRRSLAFKDVAPLVRIEGLHFVSLQKGEAATQARDGVPDAMLHDWTEELHDFADTAALVEALDLVISVDTAVAHLAGALGKPVWLLNRFDTDWRWLRDREDSPWYPSLRLFRQPAPGDWGSVIARVAGALTRLAGG